MHSSYTSIKLVKLTHAPRMIIESITARIQLNDGIWKERDLPLDKLDQLNIIESDVYINNAIELVVNGKSWGKKSLKNKSGKLVYPMAGAECELHYVCNP